MCMVCFRQRFRALQNIYDSIGHWHHQLIDDACTQVLDEF